MAPASQARCAVVIPSWNGREDTLRCLKSLVGLPRLDIYLVDNASRDGSADAVRDGFPSVRLIENDENLGFAGACNEGIRRAIDDGADYVGVLNNDTVAISDFVAPVVEVLRDPSVGVVGPKVLHLERPGRLWAAGASLGFHPNLVILRGHGARDRGQYDRRAIVDFVPGCALFASRRTWQDVGLFNASYFAYMEDVDWCLRVRRHGLSVVYEPRATLLHSGASSTGGGYSPQRKYMHALNTVRFLRSHGTTRLWAGFVFFDCLLWPATLGLGLVTGRTRAALEKARGIIDGLRGRSVSPPAEGP